MVAEIALTDEAHERLDACRREGESSSDEALRSTDERPLLDIAGTGSAEDDTEDAVEGVRENPNGSLSRLNPDPVLRRNPLDR